MQTLPLVLALLLCLLCEQVLAQRLLMLLLLLLLVLLLLLMLALLVLRVLSAVTPDVGNNNCRNKSHTNEHWNNFRVNEVSENTRKSFMSNRQTRQQIIKYGTFWTHILNYSPVNERLCSLCT